jgi:hypothetical protein
VAWPASPRIEYMIALYISAGRVAADPRYGEPATRLAHAARQMALRTPCCAGSTGWKETTGAAPLSTLGGDLPDRHPGADGRPPRSKARIRYDLSNQSAAETLPSAAEECAAGGRV